MSTSQKKDQIHTFIAFYKELSTYFWDAMQIQIHPFGGIVRRLMDSHPDSMEGGDYDFIIDLDKVDPDFNNYIETNIGWGEWLKKSLPECWTLQKDVLDTYTQLNFEHLRYTIPFHGDTLKTVDFVIVHNYDPTNEDFYCNQMCIYKGAIIPLSLWSCDCNITTSNDDMWTISKAHADTEYLIRCISGVALHEARAVHSHTFPQTPSNHFSPKVIRIAKRADEMHNKGYSVTLQDGIHYNPPGSKECCIVGETDCGTLTVDNTPATTTPSIWDTPTSYTISWKGMNTPPEEKKTRQRERRRPRDIPTPELLEHFFKMYCSKNISRPCAINRAWFKTYNELSKRLAPTNTRAAPAPAPPSTDLRYAHETKQAADDILNFIRKPHTACIDDDEYDAFEDSVKRATYEYWRDT